MKITSIKLILPALVSLFAVSSCVKDRDAKPSTTYTIKGAADGSQQVPAVLTGGTGNITGTYNSETRVLTFNSTYSGLSNIPTVAGIYSGPVGVNGTSTIPWTLGASAAGSSGNVASTFTLNDIQNVELINGGLYYAYSTATFPAGEIRGQITAVPQ